jgi:hypothetical protein
LGDNFNDIFNAMTLFHQYQPNSIKIKLYFFKLVNKAEIEKIVCYTRFTRHVVELVPLECRALLAALIVP